MVGTLAPYSHALGGEESGRPFPFLVTIVMGIHVGHWIRRRNSDGGCGGHERGWRAVDEGGGAGGKGERDGQRIQRR